MQVSEVFNEDCLEGMLRYPNKFFDLAILDPPYGRGEHGGKNRGSLVKQINGNRTFVDGGKYSLKAWDKEPPGQIFFEEVFRVSKRQIIWGCNYFPMVWGPGRIIWDKCNDGSDQSGAEIAFNSMTDRVDLFRFMWRGMLQGKSISEGHIQQGNKQFNEKRIHPTQKPIALYGWLLQNFGRLGDRILDTHMGSQSSRIAALRLGYDFYGWEIDEQYFVDGCQRFNAIPAQLPF